MNRKFIEHSTEIKQWIQFFEQAGINFVHAIDYALIFVDNRMTVDVLSELEESSLKSMGINVMGDILAILKHLNKIKTKCCLDSKKLFPHHNKSSCQNLMQDQNHRSESSEKMISQSLLLNDGTAPSSSSAEEPSGIRDYSTFKVDKLLSDGQFTKSQKVMLRHEKLFGIGRLKRKSIKSRLGPRAIICQCKSSVFDNNRSECSKLAKSSEFYADNKAAASEWGHDILEANPHHCNCPEFLQDYYKTQNRIDSDQNLPWTKCDNQKSTSRSTSTTAPHHLYTSFSGSTATNAKDRRLIAGKRNSPWKKLIADTLCSFKKHCPEPLLSSTPLNNKKSTEAFSVNAQQTELKIEPVNQSNRQWKHPNSISEWCSEESKSHLLNYHDLTMTIGNNAIQNLENATEAGLPEIEHPTRSNSKVHRDYSIGMIESQREWYPANDPPQNLKLSYNVEIPPGAFGQFLKEEEKSHSEMITESDNSSMVGDDLSTDDTEMIYEERNIECCCYKRQASFDKAKDDRSIALNKNDSISFLKCKSNKKNPLINNRQIMPKFSNRSGRMQCEKR